MWNYQSTRNFAAVLFRRVGRAILPAAGLPEFSTYLTIAFAEMWRKA